MVDKVTLYRAPTSNADADAIADWLGERIEASVSMDERFLGQYSDDTLPEEIAETRVTSPYERDTGNTMTGIVRYEERAIDDPEREGGVLYDGLGLQQRLATRISSDDRGLDHAHVVLLDRAIGTWGDHDGRWHKRVNVLGQPALVSIPGLYEAPAKPEAYYKAKQKHALVSGGAPPREVLESEIDGDFLVDADPRTTEAIKGYVLQAVHYLETGNAFCENEGCRLANPHRQPGVVEAQLREPAFCAEHQARYE